MAIATPVPPDAAPLTVSLGDLYLSFMQVSLSGFGGALAWTRRKFVEQRRWLTPEEFAEVLSFCQFLPGPNIVNLAVFLGLRFQGARGAVTAVAGVVMAPSVVVLSLGVLYTRYGDVTAVEGALTGISAAAAGLLLSMGAKMAYAYRDRPAAGFFGALAFLGAGPLQWPLYYVLLGLAPPSVAVSWLSWMRRR